MKKGVTEMTANKFLSPKLEALECREVLSANMPELTTNQLLVTGIYREMLLRDPDPTGLDYFSSQMNSGWKTQKVADAIYGSPEFRQNQVTAWYQSFLGRKPDTAGLANWTKLLANGTSEERVIAAITASDEYYSTQGGTPDTFIRGLYLEILGRNPNNNDYETWVAKTVQGTPRIAITSGFTLSSEFIDQRVWRMYDKILARHVGLDEIGSWNMAWNASGGMRGVTASVVGSAESMARLSTSGLVQYPDQSQLPQLQKLFTAQYTEAADGFVKQFNTLMGASLGNPPANQTLWDQTRSGGGVDGFPYDESITFYWNSAPVSHLFPMQNEIDIAKSLLGPLHNNPDLVNTYLQAVIAPVLVEGKQVVAGNGRAYINEGTYRWSQLYLINPQAIIQTIDQVYLDEPFEGIKVLQVQVMKELGRLPDQPIVSTGDLLTMSPSDFETWVTANIVQSALDAFAANGVAGLPAVIAYLWANVLMMRQFNPPIPEAVNEGFLPHPSDFNAALQLLASGNVNFSNPYFSRLGT